MTVKECYTKLGGDYEGVVGRFRGEERVQRFALKFLSDSSYEELCQALEAQNVADAFRAAHTLKGVAQNLGFTPLYQSSHEMTEALRDGHPGDVSALLQQIRADYEQTVAALNGLKAEQQG